MGGYVTHPGAVGITSVGHSGGAGAAPTAGQPQATAMSGHGGDPKATTMGGLGSTASTEANTATNNIIDSFFRESALSREDVMVLAAAAQLVLLGSLLYSQVSA